MYKRYIKDKDWSKIYSVLKGIRQIRVGNQEKTRRFLEGVYFIMRTGAQWRELPAAYGKWRSVHKRYETWCSKDLWNIVLQFFSQDRDGQSIMIDSTIIRADPCAAGYKKDSQTEQALSLM